MFDQILAIVKEYSQKSIVENTAIPNTQNDAAIDLVAETIFSSLKNAVTSGEITQLMNLAGNTQALSSSSIVQQIISALTGELASKLGISNTTAASVANSTVGNVLSGVIGKLTAGGGNLDMASLAKSFLSGNAAGGLTAALDVNRDGKVNLADALANVGGGGLGAAASKILGDVLK